MRPSVFPSEPRFSIVVTCHNQREFIRDAVDSALAQAFDSKEIIVVDDGSTDGSVDVLMRYGDAITLHAFRQNVGPLNARNQGAALAQGDYIAFLDGDDALWPWTLAVYEQLIADRFPKVILGAKLWCHDVVDASSDRDAPGAIEFVEYDTLFSKDRAADMGASTFVIERATFREIGGWTPGIFQLDNYDICTKVGAAGPAILIRAPKTALYRIHAANTIHSVQPFLQMAHHLLDREAAGLYPGGREFRFYRRAWLGGMIFFWIKRALKAGLYLDAIKLAARGFSMVLAAVVRRCAVRARGQRPFESVAFVHQPARADARSCRQA
jgi:glycosyltransferase involved in cell wall biosynthesis